MMRVDPVLCTGSASKFDRPFVVSWGYFRRGQKIELKCLMKKVGVT